MPSWNTLTGQPPIAIAHRGASGYRPEHTLESYQLAIALGADFIEPDLVITKDGVLVARHENELSDTTDVADHPEFRDRATTRTIDGIERSGWFTEDFTLTELKTLRVRERLPFRDQAWNGQFTIPTFAEILTLLQKTEQATGRSLGVYPETKHPSYFRAIGLPLESSMLTTLSDFGYDRADSPVFLQSFETENLKWLRSRTELPLIQLIGNATERQVDTARFYSELLTTEGLGAIASYADGIGPDKRWIVPVDRDRPDTLLPATDLVNRAHAAGLQVHPYTFRSEPEFLHPTYRDPLEEYEQFFELGVDGVFSDGVDVAILGRDRVLNP
jgi:glycerophosphoryl diester phosphodiesterase